MTDDTNTDTNDRPTKEESTIGRWGAKVLANVPKPMFGIRGTLFKRMAVKSLENYHKTAGGDAVAINAQAGQKVEFEPVLYKTPEECEEGERPGWHVQGRDKVWNPAAEGNSVNYLGKTPVVNLEDDDHVEAGFLAPRIGQAIELDNYRPIFTNPQFNAVLDAGSATDGQPARADGGTNFDLELDAPGLFSGDNLIDLDSGAGYDGMRISAAKAREWQAEHTDSEQMQAQEDRGRLIGMLNGDDGPSMFKFIALWIGSLLAALALILIGPELISGGGGGGGGMNPLMISMLSMGRL